MNILCKNLILYIIKFLDGKNMLSLLSTCKKYYSYLVDITEIELKNLPKNPKILFKFKNIKKLIVNHINIEGDCYIEIPEYVKKINIHYNYIKFFEFHNKIDKLIINNENGGLHPCLFNFRIPKTIKKLKIIANTNNKYDIPNNYMSKCSIEKLNCMVYSFKEFSPTIKYAKCRYVIKIGRDMEFLSGIFMGPYDKKIKTFKINGIFKFLEKIDLRNITNIIFNNYFFCPFILKK